MLIFTTAIVFSIHFLRYQRNTGPAAVTTTQQVPKYETQPQQPPQQQPQYQQPQYQQQVSQQQQYQAQQPYQAPQPYGQQYAQPQAQFDQSGEHKIAV